jgi:uncharacterized protein with HEPN domain
LTKDLRKYLLDVIQAIVSIEEISVGLTLEDMNRTATRWALERGVAIIGEALYQADKLNKDLAITNLSRIKATRHIVVHDYDVVDRTQIFCYRSKTFATIENRGRKYSEGIRLVCLRSY